MLHRRTTPRWSAAAAVIAAVTLTAGLAGPTGSAGAAPVPPGSPLHEYSHEEARASFGSKDGRFRDRCQRHPYRYRVKPRGTDWSLELFLVDPRGERVGTGYEWKGQDPTRGTGKFRFCGRTTRPGTYTVKARLTWDDGAYHEKWLKPRKIRLRR
ncbi:hypothetical protein [Nocardioides coralli]|uniref:hypothetical protein n=1 Tax=Nocardioides coralli TaxID=2872154 RepID=UPI001CA3A47A|nr:hypothetical protein [Nocardioides coralli]QZY29603.1 hypothetical protein K6T13_02610 [Nocardioides coralli]